MGDTYDLSSKVHIDGEILNRSSFKKTVDEKLARRVGNESTNPLFVSVIAPPAVGGSGPIIEYGSISSLIKDVLTTILTFTVPVLKTLALKKIEVSGDNPAIYQVEFDAVVKGKRRTYWADFNADFEFKEFNLVTGTVVRVRVIHSQSIVSDFDATLLGELS